MSLAPAPSISSSDRRLDRDYARNSGTYAGDGSSSSRSGTSSYVAANEQGSYSNLLGRGASVIEQVNKEVFGHDSFREGQLDVVRAALHGRDVFVLMPTGGGKSLCYQLPACCDCGLTIVISPLISLVQDQCDSLRECGIEAGQLTGHMDADQAREVYSHLHRRARASSVRVRLSSTRPSFGCGTWP